jgi:hypothetical protein
MPILTKSAQPAIVGSSQQSRAGGCCGFWATWSGGLHYSDRHCCHLCGLGFSPEATEQTDVSVSEAAPDRRHIIVMISLVFAAWAAVIFDFYTRDSQPSAELIEMWTAQPPVYSMAVNTKELAKYKNGYKIAMIVRVNFADRDLMTDTVIEKSGMYTITGDRIAIAHATSGTLRFAALQPNNIQVFLILLPNSSSIDSVKSIGDVEKFGGKILTSRGQVVIGGPPDGTKISP